MSNDDAAPDDAATPVVPALEQEPLVEAAADPIVAAAAVAAVDPVGDGVAAEPDAGPDGEPEVEEESEPWVSPGWTTPREPPGPDDVPLSNLPPPADGDQPEAEAPAVPARPTRGAARSRRPRLLVAAVLVAVLASALALAQAQDASDLREQRDDQRAITEVAGRFGAAYLSFDYAHADRSGQAVTALATKAFAESYAAQSAPGIQQLFTSGQTTTKATTTAVYLGRVDGVHARALVVVDVAASSPTDGKQQLDDVSFLLDLERTGDGWRVAKVARTPQPELATTTTAAAP